MDSTPSYLEDRIAQIPAVRLLLALGWQYLTPAEANTLRGNDNRRVLLEGVLLDWLRTHNRIQHKGRSYEFTASGFAEVLRTLRDVPLNQSVVPMNAALYDRLTLPIGVRQDIDGDQRSFDVNVIDWQHPENNVYHVTEEFEVATRGGTPPTRRPDMVLFVNGIPLVVIECKRPDKQTGMGEKGVQAGVTQMIRNQNADEISLLFAYSQLLMAISVNDALYATTGTKKDFWAGWQEEAQSDAALMPFVNKALTADEKTRLYDWRDYGYSVRQYFEAQDTAGERLPTTQDRALAALLHPARLLELAYQYLVFDGGEKKITRYQQYFAIRSTTQRVLAREPNGKRAGGVIWHTTGSGKSLTMVMLAKALALHPAIVNPRVVIVTDRIDLDDQITGTFKACGKRVAQAQSGAHLVELIRDPAHEIITTVIDKFEAAARSHLSDPSVNVFVLVDESHRGQYGSSHARMTEVFPNGCYIGFTGTPLLKAEKSTAAKFGGFIHKYTMRQAVADKAVVPLLYEGRLVDMEVSRDALDTWFQRRTATLNAAQQTDLKRKMSRYEEVNRTEARLRAIAWDIAEHYTKNFRGTGFKAQLATASKELALRYKQALTEEGITCEVVISAPDTREGSTEVDETTLPLVHDFWKKTMQRYGSEDKYLNEVKRQFRLEDGLEILIVVDKLLVGFDEPRNTVLYVDKSLREHGLLQAIARVNRLYPGKDYGYVVDYRGVLGDLNEALQTYSELEGFDTEDIAGTVTDTAAVLAELPVLHDRIWSIFDAVPNHQDNEAMERWLEPEDRRQHFYDALNAFARALKVALSTIEFYTSVPDARIKGYKNDLTFFHRLRTSVQLRYAEAIHYGDYEQKIRKLLNDHIQAPGVSVLTPEVNIFDETAFAAAVAQLKTPAARAESIAHHLKKTATEKLDENPAFYRRFSQMIEDTLADYREGRLAELDFLERMSASVEELRTGRDASLPAALTPNTDAAAYYGLLSEAISQVTGQSADGMAADLADLALRCEDAINRRKTRDWVHSPDRLKQMEQDLEDAFYNFTNADGVTLLTGTSMIPLIETLLATARQRDGA